VSEIPTVLRTELYAVAALIGSAVMAAGRMVHLPSAVAAIAGAVLCFAMRFAAMRHGWQLPTAHLSNQPDGEKRVRSEPSTPSSDR
jgi:uncharacterized membrane protein YeiH